MVTDVLSPLWNTTEFLGFCGYWKETYQTPLPLGDWAEDHFGPEARLMIEYVCSHPVNGVYYKRPLPYTPHGKLITRYAWCTSLFTVKSVETSGSSCDLPIEHLDIKQPAFQYTFDTFEAAILWLLQYYRPVRLTK